MVEIAFQNSWNRFRRSYELLTGFQLKVAVDDGGPAIGVPAVRESVQELLAARLFNILDAATESLIPDEAGAPTNLKERLRWLNKAGEIEDFEELTNLRRRFETGDAITFSRDRWDAERDLPRTYALVERQLLVWQLIEWDPWDYTPKVQWGVENDSSVSEIGLSPAGRRFRVRGRSGEFVVRGFEPGSEEDGARFFPMSARLELIEDRVNMLNHNLVMDEQGVKDAYGGDALMQHRYWTSLRLDGEIAAMEEILAATTKKSDQKMAAAQLRRLEDIRARRARIERAASKKPDAPAAPVKLKKSKKAKRA